MGEDSKPCSDCRQVCFITALSRPFCPSCCGNNTAVSRCTGEQHDDYINVDKSRYHLIIQTLALPSQGAELRHTRRAQQPNRPKNITMFRVAVMASFTVQPEVCGVHKAVTDGSMSSLGHYMMRGGAQIFECATGHLSGSVAV